MKLLSAFLLVCASVVSTAQELDPLGSGLPASHTLATLPKELVAIQPQLVGDSVSSLLSMSMSMSSGYTEAKGSINPFLIRELGQTFWVITEELKQGTGAMVKGYKLSHNPFDPFSSLTSDQLVFRLQYIRRDSMVSFVVRPDLSPENLKTAVNGPAPTVMSPPLLAAKKAAAMSNVKQIATGMMILLSDTEDIFPYAQSTAQMFDLTMPYLKNNELLKSMNPNGGRLLFNMSLAGASATEIEKPFEVPMIWDEKPWPDGKWLVAFADSHAKMLTQEEWDGLAKNLKLKLKKHGKPLKPGQTPGQKLGLIK